MGTWEPSSWWHEPGGEVVVVDLALSARVGRSCTVVRVGGEIDMETSPQLHDFLQKVADEGATHVVLDFADVTFMDSSGLGVLMVWFKELDGSGGRLGVAAAQPTVRYVLQVSAVDRVLTMYDTVDAAEADLAPPAP